MKTLQEAFTKSAEHLLKQGFKSQLSSHIGTSEPMCAYRGDAGMCAIGCLITADNYSPDLEGHSITEDDGEGYDPIESALCDSGWPIDDNAVLLYAELQSIHDNSIPDLWLMDLQSLAAKFSLELNH